MFNNKAICMHPFLLIWFVSTLFLGFMNVYSLNAKAEHSTETNYGSHRYYSDIDTVFFENSLYSKYYDIYEDEYQARISENDQSLGRRKNYATSLDGIEIGVLGNCYLDQIETRQYLESLAKVSEIDLAYPYYITGLLFEDSYVRLVRSELYAWGESYGDFASTEEFYFFQICNPMGNKHITYDVIFDLGEIAEGGYWVDVKILAVRPENLNGYDDEIHEYVENMKVVNCNEWVSFRFDPDMTSEKIKEVPLGTIVSHCYRENEDFIRCDYDGLSGYILAKYLTKVS